MSTFSFHRKLEIWHHCRLAPADASAFRSSSFHNYFPFVNVNTYTSNLSFHFSFNTRPLSYRIVCVCVIISNILKTRCYTVRCTPRLDRKPNTNHTPCQRLDNETQNSLEGRAVSIVHHNTKHNLHKTNATASSCRNRLTPNNAPDTHFQHAIEKWKLYIYIDFHKAYFHIQLDARQVLGVSRAATHNTPRHQSHQPLAAMLSKFFNWTVRMPTSQLLIVVSVTSGVVLLGVLAQYLKRRKSPRPVRRARKFVGRRSRNSVRSPNGGSG